MEDAAMGAFPVFFTQSPSFPAFQRTTEQNKGKSNAQTLFGMRHIPCDNHIRVEVTHFDFKILILLIAICAMHNVDSIKINRLIFQLRKS